jgi:hypothetical protein
VTWTHQAVSDLRSKISKINIFIELKYLNTVTAAYHPVKVELSKRDKSFYNVYNFFCRYKMESDANSIKRADCNIFTYWSIDHDLVFQIYK